LARVKFLGNYFFASLVAGGNNPWFKGIEIGHETGLNPRSNIIGSCCSFN